ncbi:hypothetical protein ACFW1A_06110 [Kitasatospora sp. NPDC058965]|uniref:hypothetical protein n=1 Tax=Kitasatospora sp. NPDC058965 TaxID=3346682 RepID=UPI0036CE8285
MTVAAESVALGPGHRAGATGRIADTLHRAGARCRALRRRSGRRGADRITVRPWAAQALRPSALGRRGPVLGAAQLTVCRILAAPTLLPA